MNDNSLFWIWSAPAYANDLVRSLLLIDNNNTKKGYFWRGESTMIDLTIAWAIVSWCVGVWEWGYVLIQWMI